MFRKLSYKKKNRLLLIITVLFAVMIYSFAIQPTTTLYRESSELERQLLLAENAPVETAKLEMKLAEMNTAVGSQHQNSMNVQQALLGIITAYCQSNNTILREFPKTINTEEKDILIETNVFVLEGSFSKLLRFLYQLEQKDKVGRVASVSFQAKRDHKTKVLSLTATVYVQSIKTNKKI